MAVKLPTSSYPHSLLSHTHFCDYGGLKEEVKSYSYSISLYTLLSSNLQPQSHARIHNIQKTNPSNSTVTTQTNPRGIPVAPFIDNVSDYVSSRDEVEPTLRSFQEMISKYQFMEVNTQRRGQGLREKIPDIRKTLEMVRFLQLRKEVNIPRAYP